MRVHDWLVAVAALTLLGTTAACGRGGDLAFSPLRCTNYPAFDTTVAIPPTGEMVRLPWPGNFVRFPNRAVSDTALYRIAAIDSIIGVRVEPVDGAPTQFGDSIYIRLNYSPCRPRASDIPRKLIFDAGSGWDTIPGSGTTGQPREVFGRVDHLTAFAIAN